MKTQATFVAIADSSELQSLRDEYLDQLEHAQAASIEVLLPSSQYFAIVVEGERCGYFITHAEHTLLEFYVTRPYWVYAQVIVEQLLAQGTIQRALVKSFDHLLFSSCIAKQTAVRVAGLLVRDLQPRELAASTDLRFAARLATSDDLPALLAVDQQVFRDPERLRRVVEGGHCYVFESEQALLGFGIARPIIAGRKHVELGIAVDKPWRLKGHSVHIFRSLLDSCLERGLSPVAGLSPDNVASRSMGERAGMISRHRLLDISFV